MAFETHKRKVEGSSTKALVTIRKSGFAVNANFARLAGVADRPSWVELAFDSESNRVGLRFFDHKASEDSYVVSGDGGSSARKKSAGKIIACSDFLKTHPMLFAMSQSSPSIKRQVEKLHGYWVFEVVPSFELQWDEKNSDDHRHCVYCYLDKDEIVYIGQGHLKERINSPERLDWQYDKVRYSRVSDASAAISWENYHIEEFRSKNGRLPRYNLVSGHSGANI